MQCSAGEEASREANNPISFLQNKSEEPLINPKWQNMIPLLLTIQSQSIPYVSNACIFILYYRINVGKVADPV
jgi:hypothetical protein